MTTLRPAISNRWQTTAGLFKTPARSIRVAGPALGTSSAYHMSHPLQSKAEQTRQPSSSPKAQASGLTTEITRNHAAGMRSLHALNSHSVIQSRASYNTEAVASKQPTIHSVFETKTGTWQYVVADPSTMTAVIIDPVLDYDPATQVVITQTADSLLSLVREKGYKIAWILETHAHADHLTASSYLQKHLGQEQGQRPPIGIGRRIGKVQELFGKKYGIPTKEHQIVFDKLFDDDEEFEIGNLRATAIHLPGHTPDHMGYKIGDNVFCGDSVFNADIGTARCDFPGGSAVDLWNSARTLLALPDHTKIWTGHDYPPDGRSEPMPYMSVKDHKEQNKHLKDSITEEKFLAMRKERDASLAAPRLLDQSLQINIRGGRLPEPTEAGQRLLHLPLKLKGAEW
ncbi:Metallo-hydrolase/oxidoreductase [Melanomma pulvis-pyrius CBS 109.77]|uniref:Metallo-hydrolase/oxidoreductase n=1 Tax=Melanomma pulvis-pyrius CBS 109.77 TaxID=1314802 RepID=A0A6A6XSQ3_9PLEO|nr:Metallo-hydrolase/oxidoreductase [Melanomma pulvis-pyrius CBS 109.77]